ncbi:MAG: DHH family phosphoesterase [Eggerthellaceae bacterium]|jgi:phosphoesterase RecJ-like protein|nr:DHH family phosphoesterase [Eggerthellaceae bacterium]MCH4221628.1 DHH family phosphoesterase [Eggerthellaceae bacterium]
MSYCEADLRRVAQELKDHDNYVICGHVSPDGDCIGSQLALMHALCAMGKKARCVLAQAEPVDFGLRFLPGTKDMVPARDLRGSFSTFVSVDVPELSRMGNAAMRLSHKADMVISIDHHIPDGEPMGSVRYVDSDSPATALIIWRLISLMGVQPSSAMAICCYTGTVTDTGRFQYQNTTADTFEYAAEMVRAGADPAQVSCSVFQNRTRASLELERRMLTSMSFYANDSCAVGVVHRSDFLETGATKVDAMPLIDTIRSIRGVRVVCILREQEHDVRGSLRAKDDTDVAAMARIIGGGGHRAAAGFTFKGSLEDAHACIAQLFSQLFDDSDAMLPEGQDSSCSAVLAADQSADATSRD